MNQSTSKLIILLGLGLVFIGLVLYFTNGKLDWIGNLPGDIRIEGERTKVYIPITTMILFSILASVAMWLYRYFQS